MYLKRQKASNYWPIPRKGTKYLVVPSHHKKQGVPVLIILRELMKVASNRKEAREIIKKELVKLNGKIVKQENMSVVPFDIIEIGNKKYELGFSESRKFIIK